MPDADRLQLPTFLGAAGARQVKLALIAGVLLPCLPADGGARPAETPGERVFEGLEVLHDCRRGEGTAVKDRQRAEPRLHLHIAAPEAVRRSAGGIEIAGAAVLRSRQPAVRIVEAIRKSNALTLEAWVRPGSGDQRGPARILTLSRNPTERNVTLGQDGDRFEVRLRTTATSTNGLPALVSAPGTARQEWTHVVYTRDRGGNARLYIDGKLNAEQEIEGSTSSWDSSFELAAANELTGDRPWLGSLRILAIYSRALSPQEVAQNYRVDAAVAPEAAGTAAAAPPAGPAAGDRGARLFELSVAPILSRHCLECHDTALSKGDLDLSRRGAALKGGATGAAIAPNDPGASLLWRLVESDEMPRGRPPLSGDEKKAILTWLDAGAAWPLDVIDPAVYAHGAGRRQVFVQRLTVPEYIDTVRSVLGVDIDREARERLPRDSAADGFRNTAYNLTVDFSHVRAYAELAEVIAGRVDIAALARRHTESRELTDENITNVVKPLSLSLLRAPLGDGERARYCGISTTVASSGGGFDDALRHILEVMLQSPRFLYRIEGQQGDGSPRPAEPFELAARMSYILWGEPPDQELIGAAAGGKLDRAGVKKHVQRMLRDPRTVSRSLRFVSEWLDLDRLDNLRPSPERFPNWNPALAAAMRDETLAYFEEVAWKQGRPLPDLLHAPVTFASAELARHYGLPLETPPEAGAMARFDLSATPGRGGLLTQGSLLVIGGDDASMVTRGLFILHELLRGSVRDPPPCVDTTPVPSKPGLTQRGVAEARLANKRCSGCHSRFEPLAFALERYDGTGAYRRTDEHGNTLRDDGEVLIPGEATPHAYASTAEMMKLLASSDRVSETLTWKVAQFALGRPLGAADAAAVSAVHRRAREDGGTYAAVIGAIVLSDLVQLTPTEPADGTR